MSKTVNVEVNMYTLIDGMMGNGNSGELLNILSCAASVIIRRYATQLPSAEKQIDVFIDRMGDNDLSPVTRMLIEKLAKRFPYVDHNGSWRLAVEKERGE